MLACAGSTWGQQTDNDYYVSRGTALLRTVEQYHLGQAEDEIRNNNYEPAWADLNFILRFFPNHPQALLLMGQLCTEHYVRRCDLDVLFEKAISVNPNVAGTYISRGVYLHRVKRYGQAIESYQRALALDPDSVNAHYNLALAYLETKQYGLANEHAQRAYALGAPLPGLRERLKQIKQWKPDAVTGADPQTPSPAAAAEGRVTAAPAKGQAQ